MPGDHFRLVVSIPIICQHICVRSSTIKPTHVMLRCIHTMRSPLLPPPVQHCYADKWRTWTVHGSCWRMVLEDALQLYLPVTHTTRLCGTHYTEPLWQVHDSHMNYGSSQWGKHWAKKLLGPAARYVRHLSLHTNSLPVKTVWHWKWIVLHK